MLFKDSKFNHGQPLHIRPYHPYRGGQNPNFDDFSGRILDVKSERPRGISYFVQLLEPVLNQGITIVVFPSHDPDSQSSGIATIARRLAASGRVDGTGCLRRHTKVAKSATGGSRNLQKHLRSISTHDTHLITGKNVLLMDDVTTSGSSIEAGLQLLRTHGPSYLQALCLGKTA